MDQECQHRTLQGTLPASCASDRHCSSILALLPARSSQNPPRHNTPRSSHPMIQVGIQVENYLSSPTHVRVTGLRLKQSWECYQALSESQFRSGVQYFLLPHPKIEGLRVSTNGSWTQHDSEADSGFRYGTQSSLQAQGSLSKHSSLTEWYKTVDLILLWHQQRAVWGPWEALRIRTDHHPQRQAGYQNGMDTIILPKASSLHWELGENQWLFQVPKPNQYLTRIPPRTPVRGRTAPIRTRTHL